MINFSETGFSVVGAQAKALGGDVRIDGGLNSPGGAHPVATSLFSR